MNIQLKNILIDNSSEGYIPSEELVRALEIAYALKRPLLLSGEPGTGKTEFAKWVAKTLSGQGFFEKPLVYNTKSSSTAQDLFYYYDAVAHFRETRTNTGSEEDSETAITTKSPGTEISKKSAPKKKSTEDFIELKALGLAFANAKGRKNLNLGETILSKSEVTNIPARSVVLIDEIDKAPRDFPNDLLNEIEHYQFDIKEINKKIELEKPEEKERILIIMTSNFEKNLPEPFLRRCVYFHIDFPGKQQLFKIMQNRLKISDNEITSVQKRIDDFFRVYNDPNIQKKPSTSEAIDWMRALQSDGMLDHPLFENETRKKDSKILGYMSLLLKKKEDLLSYQLTEKVTIG